jgi:hypothetical protein
MKHFSPAKTNDAARNRSIRHRERLTPMSAAIAGAFVVVFLGIASPHAEAASAPRAAIENHACAEVLGLNPTEADYQACAISLDRTLSLADDAQAAARHRSGCAQQGLNPNTAAFATCVVETSEAPRTEWSGLIGAR